MRYVSVCSGIEAATVAWHPLGWTPVAFSEIEAFPRAVLAHHYPDTPNWGDMTKFQEWPDADVDVLVGGTPCQSFSVAGLRRGLDDPRGNLALTYLAIAERYRPRWLVWENVPGVLSSNGGRDFGSFLGGLGKLGYGFAYRVLDAQYFGLAQRRRRVFVVGCLGDWRRAAAVLFERESLSGNPAPRRETGKAAPTIPSRSTGGGGLGTDFDCDGGLIQQPYRVANCLTARTAKGMNTTLDEGQTPVVAHALRGEGFDVSEDGAGRGTPLVPIAWSDELTASIDVAGTLQRGGDGEPSLEAREGGTANAILTPNGGRAGIGVGAVAIPKPQAAMAVRRLTPTECERLQGFPDGYTAVIYRNKPAADGPRYKALGNSMAVPCMAWIGRRIQEVADITEERAA